MGERTRGKGRALMTVLTVLGVVVGVAVVVLVGAILFTEGERREGRELPIAAVDFAAVPDGTYLGKYEGGRYKWRANEVRVTVSSGRVTDIHVLKSATRPVPEITAPLFERVIRAQSLKVDTITQATITSKSYLKSVENALRTASGS